MNTYARLQKLLVDNEGIMDNQPSDDLYMEWAELAKAVSDTMDAFTGVLMATKACRAAQKSFFAARKVGNIIEANDHLATSKRLEKELDKLVAHWIGQMTPPVGQQTHLF